jgi:serine/threonine protein phosphatase PrpC
MNLELEPIRIRIGAGGHRGKVRSENQDRIGRFRCPFGEVFIVVDGVGGHVGGAVAAEMVIAGMERHLQSLPAETPPATALREAAQRTNAEVHRRATSGDPQTEKMGATTVLALIRGAAAFIAHAGDSRAYLLRGADLSQLTRDHSMVQQMLDHAILSPQEAREHPDANVITRAFGQQPELDLEVSGPLELGEDDRLLLCSDGLSGFVEDRALREVLVKEPNAQAAADRLIALALAAGGEDNVSVQVLAVQAPAPLPQEAPPGPPVERLPPRPGTRQRWPAIAALALVAFLAGTQLGRLRGLVEKLVVADAPASAPAKPRPMAVRHESEAPWVMLLADASSEPPGPLAAADEKAGIVLDRDDCPEDEAIGRQSAGSVYYHKGFERVARTLAGELNPSGGRSRYQVRDWPKDLGLHADVDVLVVSPECAGAAARPPSPARPAVAPSGSQARPAGRKKGKQTHSGGGSR